jgi:uncharacterized protein (DUF1697 family)
VAGAALTAPRRLVALLSGINVGGNRKVPMADLRALAEGAGYSDAATYIQSGNLVLSAPGAATTADVEAKLEAALQARFGFHVDTMVRSVVDLRAWAKASPFAAEAFADPSRVLLALTKAPPAPGAAEALVARGTLGEQVKAFDAGLWAYFPGGVGASKLTPAALDRAAGSKVTMRNWRTLEAVLALG